jgi:transposase-like protein
MGNTLSQAYPDTPHWIWLSLFWLSVALVVPLLLWLAWHGAQFLRFIFATIEFASPIRRKKEWPHNASIANRLYHAYSFVQFNNLLDECRVDINLMFFNGSNNEIIVDRAVGNYALDKHDGNGGYWVSIRSPKMSINLTDAIFNDETAAWKHFEAVRWPDGPICPHCGVINSADPIIGKTARHGLYRCRECVKQFTATIGTIYEGSHIPMHKWLLAAHLMCASKKGMSAHQLWRMLGFGSYRTAWFMAMRIREAMTPAIPGPIGGENKVVEADETLIGGKKKNRAFAKEEPKKHTVLTLIDRDGDSHSFHIANVKAKTLRETIVKVASRKSYLATDELASYEKIGKEFSGHGAVNHSVDEFARLGGFIHVNTAECRFSLMKRAVFGTRHSISEAHLPRYLAEWDFKWNTRKMTDGERAAIALEGIEGKRLTYWQTNEAANA